MILTLIGCGSFGLTALGTVDETTDLSASDTAGEAVVTGQPDTAEAGSSDSENAERDTGSDSGATPDTSEAACGDLTVTWQPSVSADYGFFIEYTEPDGDIAVPWVEVDAGEGLPELGTEITVCGGTLRLIAAGDRDGDAVDDTWSAMVSGDGCVEVGEVNCTWNGSPIDDSTLRRSDGCSNTCEAP